jgi:hypothetical protein
MYSAVSRRWVRAGFLDCSGAISSCSPTQGREVLEVRLVAGYVRTGR